MGEKGLSSFLFEKKNLIAGFLPCSTSEINLSTWEYVLCIFHSTLGRNNFQFSEMSKAADGEGRVGCLPQWGMTHRLGYTGGLTLHNPHISISAAGRKLLLRDTCSKLAENKCCFEINHLSLWLSRSNSLWGYFSGWCVWAHTGYCIKGLISKGSSFS